MLEQEQFEKAKGDALSQALLVATAYREQLEGELRAQCSSLLKVLDGNLLRNSTCTATSRAFYLKLKADYHRSVLSVTCLWPLVSTWKGLHSFAINNV